MLLIVRLKRRKKPHLVFTATTRNRRQHKQQQQQQHQSRINNKTHISTPAADRSTTLAAATKPTKATASIVRQTQKTIKLKRTLPAVLVNLRKS